MTIREAIWAFIWCDKRPAYRCSSAMIREAQEVLVSALHGPPNEEAWAELERKIGGNDGTTD